jgi:hypothetical protein
MHSDEFVRSSNQYNNILSLGAVGVDNANETRGWDRIVGHAAVRLSGRTYHYIPQMNTRNGRHMWDIVGAGANENLRWPAYVEHR